MSKKEFHFHMNLKNLICGLVSGIVLFICFASGLVVHAEQVTSGSFTYDSDDLVLLSDLYDFNMVDMGYTSGLNNSEYLTSSIYSGDVKGYSFSSSSRNGSMSNLFDGVYEPSNGEPEAYFYKTFTFNGESYDLSDFPYFILASDMYTFQLYFFNFDPTDVNYVFKGFANGSETTTDFTLIRINGSLGQGSSIGFTPRFDESTVYQSAGMPFISSTFRASVSNWDGIVDAPSDFGVSLGNDGSSQNLTYMNAVYNSDSKIKLNYMLYDSEGNMTYQNPILNGGSSDVYPDGSGGDITNNMYLRTADFRFDIPKYDNSSNWGKGTVSFYGLTNDFQDVNASDFVIDFDFYVKLNGKKYEGVSDGGEKIWRSYAYSFRYTDLDVPLQDFIDSNNLYSISVSDIFDNALDSESYTVSSRLTELRSALELKDYDWVLYCSANLKSGNYVSGNIQENYNLLTQISKETNNTITENNNPFYPEDENGDPIIPDNDQSQEIIDSNGNIILTNNDNDNITISSGNGEVAENIVDKLLPEDGNGGLSQELQESFNNNGWLELCKSVMPMLPETFWDKVGLYAIACLGIASTAFVLRLILDLL